ncbi:MAG: glutaminyl-peptide cyclotransferase [Putridiphycobacter sp.]
MRKLLLFVLVTIGLWSCDESVENNNGVKKPKVHAKIESPSNDTEYTIGDIINLELSIDSSAEISEIALFIEDTLYQDNLPKQNQTITIDSKNGKVGWVEVYLSYKDDKGNPHRDYRTLLFFSDVYPDQKMAKIQNSFPHNSSSYTQGLEFYQGKLYESTGQKGQSKIMEVDLNTGEIVRMKELESQYFGEGITILNDTIYQLTWQSNTCFMYDMAFNRIGEFTYEGEGWGLSNDGQSIIMTNGTSEIVWRNPQTFEIEKSIFAFKPDQDFPQLNEIEYIDNRLFVNVYTQNDIIEVDPQTGKVINIIDCSKLESEGRNFGDVLNGIAFNPLTGKTYMTGKLWSKLFEVTFE